MLILTVVAALALVGLLVISFIPQKKDGQADEGVTQTITDGIAQEMADSKSDAYRGLTSTDDYFEQLGARMEADEDISLVSSSGSSAPAAAAGASPVASSSESSVDRVFGAPPTSSSTLAATSSNHRSSGGVGASRPMTSDERLDYDRRRAEMVRDVLTGGAEEETPAEENSNGEQVVYEEPDERMESLISLLREPFAEYVFFYMLRDMNALPTITGLVQLKCANSYVSPLEKGVQAWNRMVEGLELFAREAKGLGVEGVTIDKNMLTYLNTFNL